MIIWINGAFGSGKTQAAHELSRRINNSIIYDPEQAGFFINKNLPKSMHRGDFQDFSMWREINYSMIKAMYKEFDGTIIIPMTVVNIQYFNEIIGRLRAEGVEIFHFTLWASKETLLKRLKKRFDYENSWPAQQIDRCIEGLANEEYSVHIETDNMTIDEVVVNIANHVSVSLLPDTRSKFRKSLDRTVTQIKQLGIFQS